MPLADVLRDYKAHPPPGVVELVRYHLGFEDFSILAAMLADPLETHQGRFFPLVRAERPVLFIRQKIKHAHPAKFFRGIAVLLDGRFIHLDKLKRFFLHDPRWKRVVGEKKAKYGFTLAQGFLGTATLNREGDMPAHGIQKLKVTHVVRVFALVVLHDKYADGRCRRFQRHTQPRRRW